MKSTINKPGKKAAGTYNLNQVQRVRNSLSFGRPPEEDEELAPGTLHSLHSDFESIMEGTLCALHILNVAYKTQDGRAIFKFEYYKEPTHIEIDILEIPSFRGRNEDGLVIHRMESARGQQICIAEHFRPTTIEKANAIAKDWSELVWRYIQTGLTLDNQIRDRSEAKKRAKRQKSGFLNWLLN